MTLNQANMHSLGIVLANAFTEDRAGRPERALPDLRLARALLDSLIAEAEAGTERQDLVERIKGDSEPLLSAERDVRANDRGEWSL
jgi:hypothetical protein